MLENLRSYLIQRRVQRFSGFPCQIGMLTTLCHLIIFCAHFSTPGTGSGHHFNATVYRQQLREPEYRHRINPNSGNLSPAPIHLIRPKPRRHRVREKKKFWGLLLGFLLGPVGVLIAYIFPRKDKHEWRKSAWTGFLALALVIATLVAASLIVFFLVFFGR